MKYFRNNASLLILLLQLLICFFIFACYYFQGYSMDFIMPYLFLLAILLIFLSNFLLEIKWYSAYSLFIFVFCIFIGGRILLYLFDGEYYPYFMDFFKTYSLDSIGIINLMSYVILGIIFIDIGYKVSYIKNVQFKSSRYISDAAFKAICLIMLVCTPLWCYARIEELILYSSANSGYLASKTWQAGEYSFKYISILDVLFSIALGYSIYKKYLRKIYIPLFLFSIIISLFIGARGPIYTGILFLIWYLFNNYKENIRVLKYAIILGLPLLWVLLTYFIEMFSFRSSISVIANVSLLDKLFSFIYNQGISLMVFDLSREVSNYPTLAYFQTVIPGASFFASLFMNVQYYMSGFQHYLARSLNEDLFNQGFGLDWTLFSDFYVFGGENLLGFSFVAFIFGNVFSIIQNSYMRPFWGVFLCAIFTRLMFLPRSSLSTVIPFFIYYVILTVAISYIILSFKYSINNHGVNHD